MLAVWIIRHGSLHRPVAVAILDQQLDKKTRKKWKRKKQKGTPPGERWDDSFFPAYALDMIIQATFRHSCPALSMKCTWVDGNPSCLRLQPCFL
jgi:hypothetical protein